MSNIILIPTYNERDNIIEIVSNIREYDKDIQIMVIDDDSPDGTAEVVQGLMKQDNSILLLNRNKKEGLGAAYIDGLCRVRSMNSIDNIITMDADGSHDPKYIQYMLEAINDHDLVIGSRYIKSGGVENWSWPRKMLSYFGNIYSRAILRIGIRDLTAGFVCFRKSLLEKLDFKQFHNSGYAYQIEFKYHCVKYHKATWVEIPIIFSERREGKSKISLSIIFGGIITPIRLRFTFLFKGDNVTF